MAGKEKVMAVLMGPFEVRQTFRDWPADMCLAVCLMDNGDCQLVVFQQEEADLLPRRLRDHLGLRSDALCFFPRVPGYPTRTLLYSDERRLMSLVAEAPEIVEEASDYSVNYAYAQEEGLDPAVFLGIEADLARGAPDAGGDVEHETRNVIDPEGPSAADFVSRRGKSAAAASETASNRAGRVRKALLPGFMQRTEQVQPGARFRSARELAMNEDLPVLCDIRPEQNGWIMVAQIHEGGGDIRIGDPDLIYLRDDHSVVAIRLEPPWAMSAALPGRIWIRARSLPPRMRAVFAGCVGPAEMTGSGAFLYLHVTSQADSVGPTRSPEQPVASPTAVPGVEAATAVSAQVEERAADASPAPVPQRPKRTMRRRFLALTGVAAALVLIQLGVQYGWNGDAGSLGSDAPINWERFRSAWQASRAG
ncbi:hypothetical protein [Antarcticimicrobium sediminis]|uniref:Uncharacterized protein n=1 Tax=Antarcticimicrobium sediminis TaxID=2546227 RepID=A0A4R5EV81_9RHOB|nr:hypothetical protein [Antarcticimicrobium sediminis]TDE38869.1 hypothetical protein E1B25_07550 [Antarcticimicrobium sediminis]